MFSDRTHETCGRQISLSSRKYQDGGDESLIGSNADYSLIVSEKGTLIIQNADRYFMLVYVLSCTLMRLGIPSYLSIEYLNYSASRGEC